MPVPGMKYIKPKRIAGLISNVPVNDAGMWSSSTTYGTGNLAVSNAYSYKWEFLLAPTNHLVISMRYSGSKWIAVYDDENDDVGVLFSVDGRTWADKGLVDAGVAKGCRDVEFKNGVWIALSQDRIYSSSDDGDSWTLRYYNSDYVVQRATANDSMFVVCGGHSSMMSSACVITSADGLTWTLNTASFNTGRLFSILYADGMFITGGTQDGMTGLLYTSTNGTTWVQRTAPSEVLINSAYGDGYYYLQADLDKLYRSTDGIAWTELNNSPSGPNVSNAFYANESHVFIHDVATKSILISDDHGETWVPTSPGPSNFFPFTIKSDGLSVFAMGGNGVSIFNADEFGHSLDYLHLFESLQGSNTNKIPVLNPSYWLSLGAINRNKMFDDIVVSKTVFPSEMIFSFSAAGVDSVALFGLVGSSVNFKLSHTSGAVVVFDENVSLTEYSASDIDQDTLDDFRNIQAIYFGFPIVSDVVDARIEVKITPVTGSVVECGKCISGVTMATGLVSVNPIVSLVDKSRVTEDDFGRLLVTKRGFLKRIECEVYYDNSELSDIYRALADARSTPTAWKLDNGYGISLLLEFGIYQDFSVVVDGIKDGFSLGRLMVRGMI